VDKSVWAHASKAPGHPYGRAWTDAKNSFGYVRISKNGSSAAVSTLNLRSTFQLAPGASATVPLYAAIRDPISRLMSSIPETLKRATVDKSQFYGSVQVNGEIYHRIIRLDTISVEKFAKGFLQIIQEYGPFDAHHESQYKFLFHLNGDPYGRINLFPLERMDIVLPLLGLRHQRKMVLPKRRNVRSTRIKHTNRPSREVTYPTDHPLSRWAGSGGKIQWNHLNNRLIEIYSDMLSSSAVIRAARHVAQSLYPQDFEIYNIVKSRTRPFSPFIGMDVVDDGIS